jgi:hypothetical protein
MGQGLKTLFWLEAGRCSEKRPASWMALRCDGCVLANYFGLHEKLWGIGFGEKA